MTPTTPTPALADLDLDKLEALAIEVEGGSIPAVARFTTTFDPAGVRQLIALARRAAQPVAPVQDEWRNLCDQMIDIWDDHKMPEEDRTYVEGAWPDLLAEIRAKLATPSPQIAEVVELPRYDMDPTAVPELSGNGEWVRYTDAIAASRRAAGGEAELNHGETVLRVQKALGITDTSWVSPDVILLRLSKLATPAPASAGQAAPAVVEPTGWREFITNIATPYSEPLNSISGYKDKASRQEFMVMLRTTAHELLAAQPAEGAGQAGQVACKNEKCEGGRHYNTEHTRSWPCPDCTAPTERAAAPAGQTSAQVKP